MSKPVSNDSEKTRGFGLSPTKKYLRKTMSSVAIKRPSNSTSSSQITLLTQYQPGTDIK